MTRIYKHESLLVESRFMWASLLVVFSIAAIIARLWFLQIYRGDYYQLISERNRIRKIEVLAPRGVIYDRNGKVILGNRPFFDLVYIPQYVDDKDTTFAILSRILHIPVASFERRLIQGGGRPRFLPITLKRNLSLHEVSVIETNKIFLPGIDVSIAPRRDYSPSTPSHLVGYLGEIDRSKLKKHNDLHADNPYIPGDLVGQQGIEARWEESLKGKRGYRFIQVDAFGRQYDRSADSQSPKLPEVPVAAGSNLVLSIDAELQQAAVFAFKGKTGAVVALRPSDGQILAMVSEPGYDPTVYQDGLSREEWRSLVTNPFNPLLDKTTGGEFPPGSVYKAVLAAAALEEKVVTTQTTFHCPGQFVLGDHIYHCHDRKGHGRVNLETALVKSCDVYFYQVGVELGVDRIAKYALALGLGSRLGVKLNFEQPGLVPTSQWKQLIYKTPWGQGETPNIAIGQGYNKVTPIQMANLFATIANGGKVWRPYYVQKIVTPYGETVAEEKPELIKTATIITPETFALLRKHLMAVVHDTSGTGRRAFQKDVTVAGKTGSVQVVSLKRTVNKDDVSMKWREHAMFAAFSPASEDAEIAIAVISENDRVGGGGMSAAPVAGAVIRAYWDLKKKRAEVSLGAKQKTTDTLLR